MKLFQIANGVIIFCGMPTAPTKCVNLNDKVSAGCPKFGHTTLERKSRYLEGRCLIRKGKDIRGRKVTESRKENTIKREKKIMYRVRGRKGRKKKHRWKLREVKE